MKTNLVRTLSLTLLLSTPLAVRALTGDPYEQQTAVKQEITDLTKNIETLTAQRAAIAPQKKELTLITSQKGVDPTLLIEAGKNISDLNLLAAETALLITEKQAAIKATQAKLPGLAARIKTLEPSADKMETLGKLRQSISGIQAWNVFDFKVCRTTEVPAELFHLFVTALMKKDTRIFREDTSKLPYLVAHKALLEARKAKKDYTLAQPVTKTARETVKQSDKTASRITAQTSNDVDARLKEGERPIVVKSAFNKEEYAQIRQWRDEERAEIESKTWTALGRYAASKLTGGYISNAPIGLPHNNDKK